MRETTSHGIQIYMPRDLDGAINKLARLGATAAENNWERAAILATWVKSDAKGGRPPKNQAKVRPVNERVSMTEFAKRGVYGFQSKDSISAWLKAWALGGLPVPIAGEKYTIPSIDFPDITKLYSGKVEDSPAPSPDELDSGDDTEDEGEDEQEADASPRGGGTGRSRPETTMLDKMLQVLDSLDPVAVLHGQTPERCELLIKTLESWLESLRDAETHQEDED